MKVVTIGNSAAAAGVVEGIRSFDRAVKLALISDEPHHIYSRPLTSYYIAGEIDKKKIFYRSRDFYEKNQVELISCKKAVKVDVSNKKIFLDDNSQIEFDKLIIASGASAVVPEIEGCKKEGVFTLRTLNDAVSIKKYAAGKTDAVMIGGGFVCLKTALALQKAGLKTTLIVSSERIMSQSLDIGGAGYAKKVLEGNGIKVILKSDVLEVYGNGSVKGVRLSTGENIKCGLVIAGKGVKPNTGFLNSEEIKINKGIVVNEKMETSAKDIYAAGDVVEAYDIARKRNSINAIWPLAYEQGWIAGKNAAGNEISYNGGIGMNSMVLFNTPFISMGLTEPKEDGYETIVHEIKSRNIYKKAVIKDNKMVGAVFAGDIERCGIFNYFIRKQIDISKIKGNLFAKKENFINFITKIGM